MSVKTNISRFFDNAIYWLIILLPFSMAIAPAPMNVLMGLLLASFLAKKMLKKEWVFTRSALNIPLLLFFIITCVSAFNSICLRDTIKGGILRLLQYILVFTIVRDEVRDKVHLKKILAFMSLGAILVSCDAVFQVAAGKDFIRGYKPILNLDLVRATASFKDANILGIYLSALAPILIGMTLYYFKGGKKIAMCFLSLFVLAAIALTYSRPTLLAIYIVLFFFGFIRKSKSLIVVLTLFTIASPFLLPQSVKNWAKDVEYNPLRFMCNDDRIAVYRNSLLMIKAHPIIGAGANTFMKSYRYYKEFPEYRNIVTLDEMKAHNNFLHMAGEIGLTGLAFFVWFLYRLFKEAKSIYNSAEDQYLKIVSLSLTACLIAFLVNGLTESSLYYSVVAGLFWYISGLTVSLKKFAYGHK